MPIERHSVGMKGWVQKCDRRRTRAEDLRWAKKAMERHIFDWRLPQMWHHHPYGLVRGRWGKGSAAWAANAPSTVRSKGFNKPLFSSRGPYGSSLMKSYQWSAWSRRSKGSNRGTFQFKLWSTQPHSIFLHEGSGNYPARPHLGFIEGDMNWFIWFLKKGLLEAGDINTAMRVTTPT